MSELFIIIYVFCKLIISTPEPRWDCRIMPVIVTPTVEERDRPAVVMYGTGEYDH